ncbi:DJ-1/PfpI family protein [Micromonospora sonneratiae]|uniref:GlxA family transcriptional regulator n=1 Tax=Micromonospora sonneratiae TaxID=1184706 RepID=A0ABW3YFM5_9ACTN
MTDRRVVVVGYDAAELLDIACVTSTFAGANRLGADPPYQVRLATPGGRPITCDSGLVLAAQETLERVRGPIDTLVVSGGTGHECSAADERLVGHVRRLARESRRVASLCTGATVLAAAGLLDGRRATTHWHYAARLAAQFPQVVVDPAPIFIRDGVVATAAGVTSALDLTLSLIEEDHGAELARWVARVLVTYLQRPGNQAQMSMFTAAPAPRTSLVRSTVDHVAGNLDADLTTNTLGRRLSVSARHLTRLFVTDIGQTPGQFVRATRVAAAAQLLSSTTLPVAAVAKRCGFGTTESLRQAFADHYGTSPTRYRASMSRTSGRSGA